MDMFSRAKSGFLSVFELIFFLSVLSGCPELTHEARTKGRWNKGGKWTTDNRLLIFVCSFVSFPLENELNFPVPAQASAGRVGNWQ